LIQFEESWIHFKGFGALVKYKENAKGHHLFWLAITRSLWNVQNNIMFKGEVANVSSIVDPITFILWFSFIGRIRNNPSFVLSNW
jgi:hypothetical protein